MLSVLSMLRCPLRRPPAQVCFIKTTNLDGETNLKIRRPMDLKGMQVRNTLSSAPSLPVLFPAGSCGGGVGRRWGRRD